jgi:hypothetical protein
VQSTRETGHSSTQFSGNRAHSFHRIQGKQGTSAHSPEEIETIVFPVQRKQGTEVYSSEETGHSSTQFRENRAQQYIVQRKQGTALHS